MNGGKDTKMYEAGVKYFCQMSDLRNLSHQNKALSIDLTERTRGKNTWSANGQIFSSMLRD